MSNRRYLDKMPNPHPHLGAMILKVIKDKRYTKAEVARQMNVSPSALAKYLENSSIQFGILWKFCIVLDYDFLAELREFYPKAFSLKENPKIAELEKEIEIYKNLLQGGK